MGTISLSPCAFGVYSKSYQEKKSRRFARTIFERTSRLLEARGIYSSCGSTTSFLKSIQTHNLARPWNSQKYTHGKWSLSSAPLQRQAVVSILDTGRDQQAVTREKRDASFKLGELSSEFEAVGDVKSRTRLLLQYAAQIPRIAEMDKVNRNRVMGCAAQAWLIMRRGADGGIQLEVDSDSELSRGLGALLVIALGGLQAEDILTVESSSMERLTRALGLQLHQPSRINGFHSMLQTVMKKTRELVHPAEIDLFPSLLIQADGVLKPQGDFAIAQAQFLQPDTDTVDRLVELLRDRNIGVVAHFYMDPEVQGVLVAAQQKWPHIHISDSLVMADSATKMAEAGCKHIAVLGVDFMAENVRAILDRGGAADVSVFRMAGESIGCSLAEAAESPAYISFLEKASKTPCSLHVIYINTSLETKAHAQAVLPTITCTSSNVVQTVLQAFAQVPGLSVWYGPDTYMGGNLVELLTQLAQLSDEAIAEVHPLHTRETIRALLPNLNYFQEGACIVHDLFGSEVVDRVRKSYGNAFQTAHFEVPGEMFSLAMEARARGMGTVGSTQTILDFISARTREATRKGFYERLRFVLGTEVGMVTAIVKAVRSELATAATAAGTQSEVEVEIIFPVSSSAISRAEGLESNSGHSIERQGIAQLSIIPGVATGEGCSISGGCATCPYMKMNSLSALMKVCQLVGTPGEGLLEGHFPRAFTQKVAGRTVTDIGCEPIVHMRHFQVNKVLSEELVHDIQARNTIL